MDFFEAIAKAFFGKPDLEPGEVEVLPVLRKCPQCGWQAQDECRVDILCPQCSTLMPYEGQVVRVS